MSCSRKSNCDCDDCCSKRKPICNDKSLSDPRILSSSRVNGSRGRNIFPTDIKQLLILLAEDEGDNDIDIVLKSSCPDNCFLCNVDPIAVFDNTLVVKEFNEGCGKFRYIDICCICTVSFKCEVLLDELFEANSISGE